MPFITEELWHAQGERALRPDRRQMAGARGEVDAAAKAEIDWLIELTAQRAHGARTSSASPPGAKLEAYLAEPCRSRRATSIERNCGRARTAGPADRRSTSQRAPDGAAMQVDRGRATLFVIPLEGVIDIEAEKARLAKALEASTKETKSLEGRLGNRQLRRAGQARSGREGPRRPRAPRGRSRAARGGAGAAGLELSDTARFRQAAADATCACRPTMRTCRHSRASATPVGTDVARNCRILRTSCQTVSTACDFRAVMR